MDLYDVMRTTFAARDFTDDPVPDDVIHRIFDAARFAPSGGNRQGGRLIVVRDADRKRELGRLSLPGLRVYAAQRAAGENPWNTIVPSVVDPDVAAASDGPALIPMFDHLDRVPVVIVACVDLKVVASLDKDLDRVGVVSGGSIYPLVWNVLLAARNEGYGGAMTTLLAAEERAVQDLLHIPRDHAVAALVVLGRPVTQLTKLTRKSVDEFATWETFDGAPVQAVGPA